jgi:hypothetical protein
MSEPTGERASRLALPNKFNRIKTMQADLGNKRSAKDIENAKAELQHVLHVALGAKNAASGIRTDRRGVIADTLLLRNILTSVTICQALSFSAATEVPKLTAPDFASVAVLTRTILESFLAMFNIAVQKYPKEEIELRLLWWDWHEVNERIRALQIIQSKRPEVAKLNERKHNLAKKIREHTSFDLIPKGLRKEFSNYKPPRSALWESNGAIAVDSGILRDHFDVQYQFLSAAAHSQPLIVSAMSKHDPNTPEIMSMLFQALTFATAYLAFSVCGFAASFPTAKEAMDTRFVHIVKLWEGVFATPYLNT